MLTATELAIARAVIYASLFDYPLTLEQLYTTLIECDRPVAALLSVYRSSDALRQIVDYRDGYFFPRGRADLIGERGRREAFSQIFLGRHQRLLRALCAMPYVRMVALSGSVAHLNLEPDGDLDLFIVTRGRHVWSVTVATILLAKLMGQRRTLCVNFVIADSMLALEQQDLFTANQVVHLKPILGRELFGAFLAANPFVARYYPNFQGGGNDRAPIASDDRARPFKSAIEALFELPSRALESLCRVAYGWHLRRRSSSWRSPDQVRLQPDALKLHTQSHRRSILDRFDCEVARALAHALDTEPAAMARGIH